MKPDEARRRRKRQEQAEKVRGDQLEHALKTGAPRDEPRPDLVPTDADKRACLREYRRLARLAAGEPEGSTKRNHLLDLAVVELARLVYIERVLGLDDLARAALTPARLVVLSVVDPQEIGRRFRALQGEPSEVALDHELTDGVAR